MTMPHPRKRNLSIPKRLQTELQALIVFGCYDSDSVLKCGKSAKKSTLITKLHKLYMTSNDHDSDHVLQIELLLEVKCRYKHLFEEKYIVTNSSTNTNTGNSQSITSKKMTIPMLITPLCLFFPKYSIV